MRLEELREEVAARIRLFPDWPKRGVQFRDIMPLMKDAQLVDKLCTAIAEHVRPTGIEAVAALEARGLLFGPLIAIRLGVPFIAVRKTGKLPGFTHRSAYVKEYGRDAVEIQGDSIDHPGQRVLLFDDLIATGGTLCAAADLLHKAGAQVEQAVVIIELAELKGRELLPDEINLFALINY